MKVFKVMFAFFAVIFVTTGAYAVQLTYTFQGIVSQLNSDDAGIISDLEVTVGTAMTYTYLVDFERDAERTFDNGTHTTLSDSPAAQMDLFYVEHLAGALLDEKNGGFYNGDMAIASMNDGYVRTDSNDSFLHGGSSDHAIYVGSQNITLADWIIGTSIIGMEVAYSSDGTYSLITTDLMITDISTAEPVPEPATLFLMIPGIIGIIGFRKRKKNKNN